LVQAVLTVQRCVRVIQCGLVLFLLLFARYLGVSWKQQSFGIAAGFGAFAGVELVAVALRASEYVSEIGLSLAVMGSYNLAILLWLGYVWRKREARESSANLLASQRWDQSLAELRYPVPAESLIPMFEGMVDRAFSRAGEDSISEFEDLPVEQPDSRPASSSATELANSASATGAPSPKR
jgi:hypothetical protein